MQIFQGCADPCACCTDKIRTYVHSPTALPAALCMLKKTLIIITNLVARERIETYIRERSDAEFTHGICPDCAKKLYPQFYKE